jgi:uncharacterized protein YndB with AHSA1/START domain
MNAPNHAARGEHVAARVPPVVKTIAVGVGPARAFEVFTAGFDRWWPRDTHSVSQSRTKQVLLEPRLGGWLGEVRDDGERFEWGRVQVWDPPRRLVTSWYPGRTPEHATRVEIRFEAENHGTRVTLTHSGWEALAGEAREVRDRYDNGWQLVFVTRFAQACGA